MSTATSSTRSQRTGRARVGIVQTCWGRALSASPVSPVPSASSIIATMRTRTSLVRAAPEISTVWTFFFADDDICTCDPSDGHLGKRWLGLSLLAVLVMIMITQPTISSLFALRRSLTLTPQVPCLCLYPLLTACHRLGRACQLCGGRHVAAWELVEEPDRGLLDRNDDREGGHKAAPPLDCIQVPPAAPGSD